MGEQWGYGDGMNDLGRARPLAESTVSDGSRRRPNHLDADRWPAVGTVLRVIGLVLLALVILGWVLTALNA
jgi:hypothetical protein